MAAPLAPMAAVLAVITGTAARADDDAPTLYRIESEATLSFARQPPATPPPTDPLPQPPATPLRFGDEGSQWWTIGAGIASGGDDYDLNLPRVAYSMFLAPDVEWSVELNGWYFSQKGEDQTGINPAMVFRWHFVHTGPWTIYADAGIGVVVSSGAVPTGGTNVNFTPKVGFGVTREITDAGGRVQLGLRWHHISNARISDDARNPARDLPMLYLGFQFPF